MKKFICLFLILLLVCSLAASAFGDYYPSPMLTQEELKTRFFPSIVTNLYRVCDSEGNLVHFLEFKDIAFEVVDDGEFYHNAKYVVKVTINTSLNEGEYIELIICDNNDINVFLDGVAVPVEKYGEYNVIHLAHSGILTI